MNFFELLFIVVWIACGIVGSLVLRHHLGSLGIPLGFVGGVALAFGAFQLIKLLVDKWVPEFPPCQCGLPEHNNYTFERWNENENGSINGGIYICPQCGKRYLKTLRRFQQILPDGSFYPYMTHRPLGRWKQEQQDSSQKVTSL